MPVDPTIPAIIGGAFVSKDLVLKLLGPTAEYLGEGLKDWTEKAQKNTGRVFEAAAKKLGSKIDEEGGVPPRVLKGILEEAPFADDELTAEYFGGVLASSRSAVPRDDRTATLISLLGRLSSYQIRFHYILYSVVKAIFNGRELNVNTEGAKGREAMQLFIPERVYVTAMDFSKEERPKENVIFDHVIWGLFKESLINQGFAMGSTEIIREFSQTAAEPGLVFTPSALGVELFLAAYGKADTSNVAFLDPNVTFESLADVQIPAGSLSTTSPGT